MSIISVTPFAMTRQVAELLWGQILKDAEFYDQQDASRFVVILGELGYNFNGDDFMAQEADHLIASAERSPAQEPTAVPHHYLASLYGGSGGIYVSLDEAAARQEAELDAGRGNIMSFQPATEDEVAWHRSMGGRIQIVEPAPTTPATEAQSEVDHQVDFQYHRLGRD